MGKPPAAGASSDRNSYRDSDLAYSALIGLHSAAWPVVSIRAIAERHGVSMKAAGLQFSLAHPAVAAVIPGASRPSRIAEDRAALREVVPADFWRELREAGLVHRDAPLPAADR